MKFTIARSTAAVLALASAAAWAGGPGGLRYEITITNLTAGQVLSPPLIATHPRDLALFEAGEPASPELAVLAQDGDASALAAALEGAPGVHVAVAGGAVPPGASTTVELRARRPHSVLSVAAMLVTTNDAFAGVNGARLPRAARTVRRLEAPAYDAGAEDNDELCAFIPGPPCGNAFADSGLAGEGFVHVHRGIHGVGDLAPYASDWRNPVARVTVRRIPGR